MVREVPGPSRGRSQCAPLGEVSPFGFSEREEPRPLEASVCHRGQYRPVAFQSTSGWDARGHLTPRPLCDRPKRTGGEQAARDPACATLRGFGPGVGASATCPLGREWPSSTRRHDVQRPLRKKGQTCTPGSTARTHEEHLHHSHNTHRRSHSGTPHAQQCRVQLCST